nr:hypothetical protein [Vibrio anguillarum]
GMKTTNGYKFKQSRFRLLESIVNKLIALNESGSPNPVNGVNPMTKSESELTFLREEQRLCLFETIKSSWIHIHHRFHV